MEPKPNVDVGLLEAGVVEPGAEEAGVFPLERLPNRFEAWPGVLPVVAPLAPNIVL